MQTGDFTKAFSGRALKVHIRKNLMIEYTWQFFHWTFQLLVLNKTH